MPPKARIWRAATSWPGWVGQPGVVDPVHGRVGRQELHDGRGVGAVAVHAHGQGLDPAQDQEAVEGPGHGARRVLDERRAGSARSSSEVATKPPTTSLWPPRYLVVEWTTTSAPRASGLLQVGRGEGVVDHHQGAPARGRARPPRRCRRCASSGLVGVSTHTRRVSGRQRRGQSRQVVEWRPVCRPSRRARGPGRPGGRSRRRRRRGCRTWSPGSQ